MKKICARAKKFTSALVGGILIYSFVGAALAQQLVINGSFESGGVQSFSTNTPGWGALTGGAAYMGSSYGIGQTIAGTRDVAEQGSYYAWFHATQGVADSIGQTMSTVIGQQYIISFWLATDGPSPNADMLVTWGPSFFDNVNNTVLLNFTPSPTAARTYQPFTFTATATTSATVLSFRAYNPTAKILLDNVSVIPGAPGAPRLNINVSPANTLTLSWTASATNYVLQQNASLATKNWMTLTNTPEILGSNNVVVLAQPAGNEFFRLKSQ